MSRSLTPARNATTSERPAQTAGREIESPLSFTAAQDLAQEIIWNGEGDQMGDRLARIESQLQSHVGRVANLEARVDRPDPDQARILSRINSKLDLLEQQQHNRREAGQPPGNNTTKRSSSDYNTDSRSVSHLDAEMDRQERAKYLQTRIEKLKELRSKYEKADME